MKKDIDLLKECLLEDTNWTKVDHNPGQQTLPPQADNEKSTLLITNRMAGMILVGQESEVLSLESASKQHNKQGTSTVLRSWRV